DSSADCRRHDGWRTESPMTPPETMDATTTDSGGLPTGLMPRDPTPEELGRRIKMLRVSCGLTLKDLEERGGISATHVSEIERGKASPTVGALSRIARALGLRPAALLEPRAPLELIWARAGETKGRKVQWGHATLESL